MRMVVEAQLVAAVMPVDGFLRLMAPRSQAGSGDQSGVQGSRPPASLTSQRRLQSTNAVYWGGSPATQSSRLGAILRMQIQVSAPHRLLQSLKVFRRGRSTAGRSVGGGRVMAATVELPSRRLRRFLWKRALCVCSRVPLAGLGSGWPAVQNKHPALAPTRRSRHSRHEKRHR